jgi:hypothetical protein
MRKCLQTAAPCAGRWLTAIGPLLVVSYLSGGEAASAAQPSAAARAASCRVVNHLADGRANVGSGTLVDASADGRAGLVLSCAHLFSEGTGRVVVQFANGQTHGALVRAVDREADLSAIEIVSPPVAPAAIELALDSSATLTACGFGGDGRYRCVAGRVVGLAETPGQSSVRLAGSVRSGDSGGGVFDARGRLVGVVWGAAGGETYASTGAPLRRFVERVLGKQSPQAGDSLNASAPACPDGTCPLAAPGSLGAAPAGRWPAAHGDKAAPVEEEKAAPDVGAGDCKACGCDERLATLASRLEALDRAKPDRDEALAPRDLAPFARADALAAVDDEHRRRHESLVERLERLPQALSTGRAAAALATTALGLSGPAGWGVLAAASAGGWLLGRRRRKKARAAPLARAQEATAAAAEPFRRGRRQVDRRQPIERDDREARQLLRLSQLEGRDPLQDALAGRLALDRLDAAAEGDADPAHARWADALRRELREAFNAVAPTKFTVNEK